MNKTIKLIIAVFVCQLAGIIGSLFTNPSSSWFTSLIKPSFNPPDWVFAPVWITLYLLMGISLYLIWNDKNTVIFFAIQLALNSIWSILFFGLHNLLLSSIEIILLWAMILAVIIKSYKISKTAAYLMIPYLLWVSFAAVLNISIFVLN